MKMGEELIIEATELCTGNVSHPAKGDLPKPRFSSPLRGL